MPIKEFSVREGARGFAARPFIVRLKKTDRLRCKTAECCVKAGEMFRFCGKKGAAVEKGKMFRFSRGGGFFTARLDKCGFVVYDYIIGRGASRRGSAFHLIAGVDL